MTKAQWLVEAVFFVGVSLFTVGFARWFCRVVFNPRIDAHKRMMFAGAVLALLMFTLSRFMQ